MPSDAKISVAARNAACNAIANLVNAGTGPGAIVFYDDTAPIPANPQTTDAANPLAAIDMAATAFGPASGGVAYANATGGGIAADSGVCAYYRMYDGNTVCIWQGTCGTVADAPVDMQLDNVDFTLNGTLTLLAMTLTVQE